MIRSLTAIAMKILDAKQMRNIDARTVREYGISTLVLMENAGARATEALEELCEDLEHRGVLLLCSKGNNGGDGFVIARKIHSNGGAVKVYILGELNAFKGAAKVNLDMLSNLPIDIQPVTSVDSIASVIEAADIIVDAIFGTGLSRQVSGLFAATIDCINTSDATV